MKITIYFFDGRYYVIEWYEVLVLAGCAAACLSAILSELGRLVLQCG